MPGMRLQRLASYRRGAEASRRFATLYYDDPRAAGVSVDGVPAGVDANDVSSRLNAAPTHWTWTPSGTV